MHCRLTGPACLSLVLVLASVSGPSVFGDLGATPQLLVNGGFEDGEGKRAADWGLWPPAGRDEGVSSLRDAEVKHAGEYSGRLRVTAPESQGIATWHHNAVPVEPGQEIVLSFWIKAEGTVKRCGCDVQLRKGLTEIVGSRAAPFLQGPFDWRQVVRRFVVPEGTDHICVVPLLEGPGTVWFDDVMAYGTPVVTAERTAQPPDIDGKLTEPCWHAGRGLSGFVLADGSGLPQNPTTAWATYDRDHLYFAFRCARKPGVPLKKTIAQRDGTVWADDDVELFLDPQGDRETYYQFVVNALGAQYDSERTDPSWTVNWRAAAQETEEAWSVEIALPLAELPLGLAVGQNWCVNFCRADRTTGEVSAWSCPFGGFHTAGRLGRLTMPDLDLTPYYVKDARERITAVQAAYDAALAGLDTTGAPADLAEPFLTRRDSIRGTLDELRALAANPDRVSPEQWAQVRPGVAALQDGIADLLAASLRLRVLNAWREGPDDQPGLGLAVASPMEKVLRDGQSLRAEVTKELRLHAARNEYEAAQVVVVSLSRRDVADCRATVTDLTGPGGARIGKENLRLSVVGYVKTGKPRYETTFVGDWPDPLLPDEPFTVTAGQVQPVWLRAYVPPGTRPGDYRGTLTVSGGSRDLTLGVVLHVFDFELPRRQHLATPFGCGPTELAQWYTGSGDYLSKLPPEVWTRWNEFMLDYRLTPTRAGQAFIREDYDAQGRVTYDYSVLDQCLGAIADRLPPRGVNLAGIGHFGWHVLNGASMTYTEDGPHAGKRCGKVQWPKTSGWASASRSLPGRLLADRHCKAFRFWVRSLDPAFEAERIVAFVNSFPNRWVTAFPVGGTDWHEVRLPVEQYHHNTTGKPLTLDDLRACDNFQFVIDNKEQVIQFLVDDVVAECEGGDIVVDDFELESELGEIQARVAANVEHAKEKGWFEAGHCYGWDEVRPEEYEQVIDAYRQTLSVAPDVPIMQTYYTNRTPTDLIGTVKVWCAITSIYDEAFLEARRAAGEDVWLYVCCGPTPPYGNFFVDQPGVDHRIVFWQAWQKHVVGFLYWRVDYWHGMLPKGPGETLWPDVPWDCEKLATYNEFKVNGDGWLIYPWRDWTPLPSVRLENIRDGVEDYEYLWLLRELDPGNELLTVGEDISRDFTHFCKDPAVIQARRLAVARAIEAAARR